MEQIGGPWTPVSLATRRRAVILYTCNRIIQALNRFIVSTYLTYLNHQLSSKLVAEENDRRLLWDKTIDLRAWQEAGIAFDCSRLLDSPIMDAGFLPTLNDADLAYTARLRETLKSSETKIADEKRAERAAQQATGARPKTTAQQNQQPPIEDQTRTKHGQDDPIDYCTSLIGSMMFQC